MNTYLLTVTDLFGGEANFSWVRRYKVTAKSHLGAIQKLAKHTGASWRRSLSDRYDSGGSCCFIEDWISDNTYKAEEL